MTPLIVRPMHPGNNHTVTASLGLGGTAKGGKDHQMEPKVHLT